MGRVLKYDLSLPPGWICPVCGRVNSPWITECSCSSNEADPCTHCFHNVHIPHDGTSIPCDYCPATPVE